MQEKLFDNMDTPEPEGQDNGEVPPEPGFKKTKVGWIPEEWEVRRLGNVMRDISAGYSANSEDRNIEEGEVGVLKVSAVSYGTFDPSAHKAVVPEERELTKLPPKAGTLIMSRSNSEELVGRSVYVSQDYPNLRIPDTLWQVEVEDDISARWLNFALASDRMRASIQSTATGTSGSMKKLAMRRLRSLKIAVPPTSEQQQIADLLSTWDQAIEQIEELLAVKERRKKALMQQLLKGETRVPGFANQDWKEKRLGDYFEYFSNRNGEEEQLPVLSCSKVHGIIPQKDKFDKRVASKDTSNYKVVEEGDLVYDPMLLWDGSIGFLKDIQKGVVSPAYYTFKFKGDDLDQVFFEHLLESHYVKYQYEAISQGTNTRRQKAPRQAFLGIEVEVPPREERQAIATILGKVGDELQMLRKERNALQRQKKGMMQKLLTGKVCVSTQTTSTQVEA